MGGRQPAGATVASACLRGCAHGAAPGPRWGSGGVGAATSSRACARRSAGGCPDICWAHVGEPASGLEGARRGARARATAASSPLRILAFGRRVKGPRGVSGQGGRQCSSKRARARSCSGRSPRQPVSRGGGEPTWAGKERGQPICAATCAPMQRAALPTAVGPWGQQTWGAGAGQERGPPIRSAAHGPMQQPPSQ